MNLNERISKIIEYSNLSPSEFADEVEVQRSSISHITSGRNKPSLDFLIKVKDRFPELEWAWLIKGEGEMLKNEEPEKIQEPEPEKSKPTSLPDLFALIDDDNFGKTESEDRVQGDFPLPRTETLRESPIPEPSTASTFLSDSQPIEKEKEKKEIQQTDNQENKIKRIVIFFENGKFESFEP